MTQWTIAPGAVAGTARVPGDKSIGHRALLFAALTGGACEVTGLSGGEDNERTARALEVMGVRLERTAGRVIVHGVGLRGLKPPIETIDCGNSGTSMRLLAGLIAGQPFRATLVGDESLSRRPMRRVTDPLGKMGAKIIDREGLPPLTIVGGPLVGIDWQSPVASAQVKSAILIAGLFAKGATTVREPGPSRDHTERMLAGLGAPIRTGPARVEPDGWDGRLAARPIAVPGDPSSAAFLIAAALLTGGTITVEEVGVNPTRTGFLDVLRAMGATIEERNRRDVAGEPVADLTVGPARLRATTIEGDLTVRSLDEIPVLCAVAARAEGTTIVKDAAELRVKESDRVATTARMLRAFGVEVEARPDGLAVTGAQALQAATVDSGGDHRIAMSAAVLALAGPAPSTISDVDNVATSFPGFRDSLEALRRR